MNVLEVFTGNPLNTPVGQRIDGATDGTLEVENWALNMEICDIINETNEGPKEAVRAIRKKISNSVGKDWRAISYCLVVLETCVKNCGRRFHIQVANKDFLHELVKIISPKNEPPVVVQEKILSLIQTWADAFRGAPDLKSVEVAYQELRSKGIDFPATDLDQMAPIHTPKGGVESPVRSTTTTAPPTVLPQSNTRAGRYTKLEDDADDDKPVPPVAYPAPVVMGGQSAAPQRPTPEQMSKLRADIDIVQGNCRVFNEMLNTATPGSSDLTPDTTELLRELSRTCRQMQQRIVLLIEQLADEQVTEVLLRVNDDLNNAFLRYNRLERYLSSSSATPAAPATLPPQPVSAAPPATAAPLQTATDSSLIDFESGSDPSPAPPRASASALAAHVDSMSLDASGANLSSINDVPSGMAQPQPPQPPQPSGTDEFDMFAQSRQYDATQHSTAASYNFQTEAGQSSGSMAAVAAAKSSPYMTSTETTTGPSATSSEFDQFLEERAVAGEKLPDIPAVGDADLASNRSTTTPAAPKTGGGRQMHNDDSENALFAL